MTSLEDIICRETAGISSGAIGSQLRAIVLTGSMARGEATSIAEGGIVRVLGDAEFFLVFKDDAPFPSHNSLTELAGRLQARLSEEKIRCAVELTPVNPEYFRRLQPTIFGCELRACGRVAWGDTSVLSLIPPFSPADIPRPDAWRLLLNRTIECLEVVPGLVQPGSDSARDFSYRLTKLCLDLATSYLVFAGKFQPTYRARTKLIQEMAERDPVAASCPLDLRGFSRQLARCTESKLGTGQPEAFQGTWVEAAGRVIEDVHRLWRWELIALTGAPAASADWELMDHWMRRQPPSARLRGWMVVVRECGWHRSWRNWPRWLGLGRQASPRHWIYALAGEIFFSLPNLPGFALGGSSGEGELPSDALSFGPLLQDTRNVENRSEWDRRNSALPIVFQSPLRAVAPEWMKLAMNIAANYHAFVEHTEA
ncbi:MAG TPA: hypothetical protein VGZ29_06215 [Terriglobia bacterium]|nr:hypothetical protein [Terriglobia bacterium]